MDAGEAKKYFSITRVEAYTDAVFAIVSPWVGSWGFLAYVFNGPLTSLLQRRERAREEAGA